MDDFFRDNDDIEVWELEEFLEDILNAEFNLVRDADNDGSDMSVVCTELCRAFSLCRQGRSAELLAHYKSSPCPPLPVVQRDEHTSAADGDNDSSDDELGPIQLTHSTSASSSRPVCSSQRSIDSDPQSSNTTSLPAASETNADGPSAMEEDDEGWTVVKRHRRT